MGLLIPGLPDDIGLDCLVRIPHRDFRAVAAVCRRWNSEIRLPDFWLRRKASGSTRQVLVMAQARVDPTVRDTGSEKHGSAPAYRLTVFEPETGGWAELPPLPGFSEGLPMFCRVVAVGLKLVVIGGWDPATGEVLNGVFVYDFISGGWRRGADVPGGPRAFFASASDFDRTVYVAGGHDGNKCALKSALAYDVAEDEWSVMPEMAMARDEAKGAFHGGKFHVIGGYETSTQGAFVASAESFDVAKRRWEPVQDSFLDSGTCPKNCAENTDGDLFMCRGADLVCRRGSKWRVVGELPAEVRSTVSYVTAWPGKVLVIGSAFDKSYYYVFDLKSQKGEKMETTEEFSGHVQSGCCLEL